MNDNELRHIISQSADKGYKALFEQYYRYVYAIVFRILQDCGSSKDTEDCVVDVFTDVILHYNTSFVGSVQAYIGTTAKHKAINLRKSLSAKTWYTVSIDDVEQELPSDQSVEELAENSELAGILLDKIDELGKPDSTIIIQKYFYNRSSKEIVQIVQLSPVAVRVRCGRTIKKLRKVLEELGITM